MLSPVSSSSLLEETTFNHLNGHLGAMPALVDQSILAYADLPSVYGQSPRWNTWQLPFKKKEKSDPIRTRFDHCCLSPYIEKLRVKR